MADRTASQAPHPGGLAAPRTAEDLLAGVMGLRSLVEASASTHEDASVIAGEVQQALEDIGLFRLMVPEQLGGYEAHPLMVLEVLKALSYMDGSTGWYAQAATTGVAVAGSMLGERAVDAIFHSGRRVTCAGQAAPTGKAERIGDSFRVTGQYSFGSGTPNASWIVGGYILHEGGRPKLRASGDPLLLVGMVPRERVEMRGNWNVLGLRGTGSYDFHVPEQMVHEDFLFDPLEDGPKRGGALYRMGFMGIPALCHAAFGAGCARRILDEWVAFARLKERGAGRTLSDMETFRKDLANSHCALQSAEHYVRGTFAQLFKQAAQGPATAEQILDSRLCSSNMIAVGTRIAQAAFTSSATAGLRNGSLIQRGFRDMQAANAHFMTGEQSFIDGGGELVSRDPLMAL